MGKILIYLCALISITTYAQNYAFFDFGKSKNATQGNWNNVVVKNHKQEVLTFDVIDFEGKETNIIFTLTDSFDFINSNGTTVPDAKLGFPSSATMDGFFGSNGFSGDVDLTGGFTLSGLDPAIYYSFSVFASRDEASKNFEALYTITGRTTGYSHFDAANNTSNTANILNIQPNANGEIKFQAEAGPSNTDDHGLFYLGAIQLIISEQPIAHWTADPRIALNYPNGGHLWEVGKTVRIKWSSLSVPEVHIEFSPNEGVTWNSIAKVSGSEQFYDLLVPNSISKHCIVRISGEGLSATSKNSFEVVPDDNVVYRIVVLGSSTAAGSGPSNINDAWVWKYRTFLTEKDTRFEVINLALGRYASHNLLPTESVIPADAKIKINPQRNISKALSLNPNALIINLPSNDASRGYSINHQLSNYSLINSVITDIPMWVTTPQPRNFKEESFKVALQLEMIEQTYKMYQNKTIDFWTGFGKVDGNGILPIYDSGDGIHMNAVAHQILYERVVEKEIHNVVKNTVDSILSVIENQIKKITVLPKYISQEATIKLNDFYGDVNISVLNLEGEEVVNESHKVKGETFIWDRKNLDSGVYFLTISNDLTSHTHKIYVN